MIRLADSLQAWGTTGFDDVFKEEAEGLDSEQLLLQKALTQSSFVSDKDFTIVILNMSETPEAIEVKAGIFYTGIIAGSCCADDPSPVDELTEYCEIRFVINKSTAEATITLLQDQ
ncbi:MAG: hypothetical protein ACN4GR_07105 [Arenicellales bacterium]